LYNVTIHRQHMFTKQRSQYTDVMPLTVIQPYVQVVRQCSQTLTFYTLTQ